DDELGQRARLAPRCSAEPCSVGERDRLWFLLIRSLHHQLLGRRLWCASEHCHYNNANNANDFCFHVNFLFLLLLSHHFTSSLWFRVSGSPNRQPMLKPDTRIRHRASDGSVLRRNPKPSSGNRTHCVPPSSGVQSSTFIAQKT